MAYGSTHVTVTVVPDLSGAHASLYKLKWGILEYKMRQNYRRELNELSRANARAAWLLATAYC